MNPIRLVAGAAILTQLGCGGLSSLSDAKCGDVPCTSPPTVSVAWQTHEIQELDLLVVVDDTATAAPVSSTFPAKLAQLADVLAQGPDGLPPLHVAFIPGTIGAQGCTPPPNRAAACGLRAGDDFLTSEYCGVQPNFSGPLSDAFACLASTGSGDCGTFQPLEAAHRALADAAHGGLKARAPFVTPGAHLGVLILATQDDASPTPVADYVSEFGAQGVDLFSPMLVAPHDCPADGPIPPVDVPRLDQFATSSALGFSISVCNPSFISALTALETRLGILKVPPLLVGARDDDPTTPGLQASCVARDDVTEADGTHVITHLLACDAAASVKPCLSIEWELDAWRPRVLRATDPVAPACGPLATFDVVNCAGCVDPADPACAVGPLQLALSQP
jgi:hypothetical protein